jgi:hypothetical protein
MLIVARNRDNFNAAGRAGRNREGIVRVDAVRVG